MAKKFWFAMVGSALTMTSYMFARWTSIEPKVTRRNITDPHWRGQRPLRIAHVSDFHGGSGIWSGEALQRIVRREAVDMVCITGDHFDPAFPAEEALAMVRGLAQEVPVYFVTGNNEEKLYQLERVKSDLRRLGVHVLDNDAAQLSVHGQPVTVVGLCDWRHYQSKDEWIWRVGSQLMRPQPKEPAGNAFHLLLSHRPEEVGLYNQMQAHLVLSGHAHGAQWRLPLIGGVFAPNQGLFPRYDYGVFRLRPKNNPYHMVVSSGFDVHPLVPRFRNRPELVIIDVTASA